MTLATRLDANTTDVTVRNGRPPLFYTVEEMQTKIDAYFFDCDEAKPKRPYTMPGLALALGFSSRSSLFDYSTRNQGHEKFAAAIKKAKLRIEMQRVEALVTCKGNPAGMIFDLKNNFGWKDQYQAEVSGPDGGPVQVGIGLVGMPPAPKDMAEWSAWYEKGMIALDQRTLANLSPLQLPSGTCEVHSDMQV